MTKHCKGCVHHHNAGHKHPEKNGLAKFNDWCCAKGSPVNVGWCKQHKAKKIRGEEG